jgi:hypothetical protein
MPPVPSRIQAAIVAPPHAAPVPIRIPPFQNVPDGTFAVERSTNLVVWSRIIQFRVPTIRVEENVVWLEYPDTIKWTEIHGATKVFYRLRPLP